VSGHRPHTIKSRIVGAGARTTRTARRAWIRHTDRLATDPDYRDALIDAAIVVAGTVIRHPLMRLLDARLILRRGPGGRRSRDEDDRPWASRRELGME
jgi:hypothetical protein